ncbi:hypothetical protein K439DRAFT_1618967 [Ramaria rubella]|nr:hypothetical protein K439DRAFT_1618967 [Ramaria rubella]
MPSQSYEERPSFDKGSGIPAFDNCCVLKTVRDINHHRGVTGPSQGSSSHAPGSPPPYTGKGRGRGFGGVTKTPSPNKKRARLESKHNNPFLVGSGSSTHKSPSSFTIPHLPLASTTSTQSASPMNTGPSVPASSTAPMSTAPLSNQLALENQGTRPHTTMGSTSTDTTPCSQQNLFETVRILPALIYYTWESDYMGTWLVYGIPLMQAVYIHTTGTSWH